MTSLLENVFAGENGLTNVLSNMLGGSLRLIFLFDKYYSEIGNNYLLREREQDTSFIFINKATNGVTTNIPSAEADGILHNETYCIVAIPSYGLLRIPSPFRDKFRIQEICYQIVNVESLIVGNSAIEYILTGLKI